MSKEALTRAAAAVGGQSSLARQLGVRQSVLWYWLEQSKRGVPGEHCEAIEKITGVSRHDLRPDIFGPAPRPELPGAAA